MSKDKKTEISQNSEVNLKRRTLAKTGIASIPVILSMTSKPVWASATRYNCTYSGQLSGNLSHPGYDEPCGGEGCSPGYWKEHPHMWHSELQPNLLFDDIFGTNVFPTMTLGDVIGLCGSHVGSVDETMVNIPVNCTNMSVCLNMVVRLGFHAVAGLQNAATGVSYDYTVPELILIVANAYNDGMKDVMEKLKDELDILNNQGSDLCSGGAACGSGKDYF